MNDQSDFSETLAKFEAFLADIEQSLRDQAMSADSTLKKIQQLRELCLQEREKAEAKVKPSED